MALLPGPILLKAQAPEVKIQFVDAVPDPDRYISYSKARPLKMEDFRAKPDAGHDAVAITSSGFRFTAGQRRSGGKTSIQIEVSCSFDRDESWMKEKGKDAHILAHEQHHFDISYLHALRFMEKLRQQRFSQDAMNEIRRIYDETVAELQAMQNQYDRDSDHGIVKDRQAAWGEKVRQDLSRLERKLR